MNHRSLNVDKIYDPIAIDGPPTHRCPHLGPCCFAVVGGKIYVIGGRLDSSYECTDIVEKYNPVSDEWTTNLEPMPSRRSGKMLHQHQRIHLCMGWRTASRNI